MPNMDCASGTVIVGRSRRSWRVSRAPGVRVGLFVMTKAWHTGFRTVPLRTVRDQTNFVSEQLDGHESGPGSDEYPVWPDVDNYLSIDVFWPHPQDGPWKVTVHWATLDERQAVIGLDLRCFARSGVRPGGWRYEDGGPAEVTREVFKRCLLYTSPSP